MTAPDASNPRPIRDAARTAYRGACAVALLAAFLLVWANGAVGILGSENNPLNLVYAGVLAVAVIGALVVGFEPRPMVRVMQLTAATQLLVGAAVLALGHFTPVVTAVFVALWLLSAWLFAKAAVDASVAPTPVSLRAHPLWRRVRWLVWGGIGGLLLLPAVAMQFTDEVDWTPFDFVVMGLLLGSVGGVFELALRMARSHAYVIGSGIAAGTGFLAVWVNLAVGIIGSEQNPANAMFFAVLVIAFFGAVLAQLQPRGLVRTMQVTAAAQAATVVATWMLDDGGVFLLPMVFTGLWLTAAQCFRMADDV